MKKILFTLLSLTAASLSFAGGAACKTDAKCDDKDSKCCCCKDDKDDKACSTDKAACEDKKHDHDGKDAETPAKK